MSEIAMQTESSRLCQFPVLATTIVLTFLGLLLSSGLQVLDPIVRHDDFPALLADPAGYYVKTLYEGRWINYFWHLRGVITPSWLNYLVYQFCWSAFAACLAVVALGDKGGPWHRIGLALLVALGPSATLMSYWYNTLIPGMVLVALYAWLSTWLSERATRWLLVVFVPLTLLAYTTYPLFLLALCLARAETRRSFRDLAGVMALFIGSFALGMLLIFTFNYFEHGVFGVPMAPWREGNPAHDLASALENFTRIWGFLKASAEVQGFGSVPLSLVHVLLLVVSILVVGRRDPWRAAYICCGILAGLGLILVQTVKTGIFLPVRVNSFAWAGYVVLLTLMILQLGEKGGLYKRMGTNLLRFFVLAYMAGSVQQALGFTTWQQQTRAMAAEVGSGDTPVYVTGTFKSLPGAKEAGIQAARGLRLRLTYLNGRTVFTCEERPEKCADLPDVMLADIPSGQVEVHHLADKVVVRLSSQIADADG